MLTFITCLFLWLQSTESEVQYVNISGRVTWADSNPLHGATVMVVGTSLGAMTDSSGCYLIENCLVSDSLSVLSRMVGMCEETRVVQCNGDDIEGLDFCLLPYGYYIPSLSSRATGRVCPDTITFYVKNWRELDLSRARIWCTSNNSCPIWATNDSTLTAALHVNYNDYYLWVYPGETINLGLLDGSTNFKAWIPINRESKLGNFDNYTTRFIDIRRWGNENLRKFGFLGAEIQGETASSSRILLVYNEQVVAIDEFYDTTVVEYPFPTFFYRVDPTLRYLLIWDIYGQNAISGDVALISLESGRVSVFDPTPDIDESRWSINRGFFVTSSSMFQLMQFHISSSGKVFWMGDEYFRSYDRFGNMLNKVALFSSFSEPVCYQDQLFNDDKEELSVIFHSSSDFYMRISNSGHIHYINKIEPWTRYLSPYQSNPYNSLTGVVWIARGEKGRSTS